MFLIVKSNITSLALSTIIPTAWWIFLSDIPIVFQIRKSMNKEALGNFKGLRSRLSQDGERADFSEKLRATPF